MHQGLMRAIRNPEEHEPELDLPIDQLDALDIFIPMGFPYGKMEVAFYFRSSHEPAACVGEGSFEEDTGHHVH